MWRQPIHGLLPVAWVHLLLTSILPTDMVKYRHRLYNFVQTRRERSLQTTIIFCIVHTVNYSILNWKWKHFQISSWISVDFLIIYRRNQKISSLYIKSNFAASFPTADLTRKHLTIYWNILQVLVNMCSSPLAYPRQKTQIV